VATHQGLGLPVMPVGARVHLSERIDLMAEVAAIGFMVSGLDPRNAGVNVEGGVGDEVSGAATVGACATRAAESKGDSVGGVPQLEPHAMGMWRARVGLKVAESRKSAQGQTINQCLRREG
jgi:hypothetical protein